MPDFFVSYTKADRQWAEWIGWHLEEAGYECRVQAWDFPPGGNFVLEMHKATQDCARTIAVLSPDYLAAAFTHPEWAAAFADDPRGEARKLVPVRVRDCKPEGLLKAIVYVDLVPCLTEADLIATLTAGVRQGRGKPGTPPVCPRNRAPRPRRPGTPPATCNLPSRNPHFTGRIELLDQVEATLSGGHVAALTAALHGLGGVGKSQIAVEYAWRNADRYDLAWWLRAERGETLLADLAALAAALVEIPADAPLEAQAKAALALLAGRTGWLLVYDNAETEAAVQPWLPQGNGHALVTSRAAAWHYLRPLAVDVLPPAIAAAFLCERSGDPDATAAAELAADLGFLPLALEQAAAFALERGLSLARTLDLYRRRRDELLRRGIPADHPESVTTTFTLAAEAVEAANPAAAQMLSLCAFLAPDAIPLDLLRPHADTLPEPLAAALADDFACGDMVAALRRYSLVKADDDTLSLHRLVQVVEQSRLGEDRRRDWAERAVALVRAAFPFKEIDLATWPPSDRLLPHAEAAAAAAEDLAMADRDTAEMLCQAGGLLDARGLHQRALGLGRRALALAERAWPAEDPKIAEFANDLGYTLNRLGQPAQAKALYERALAIDEAALGPDHPNVATDANNLGNVLRDLGDLAAAKALLERALAIDEAALGPGDPKVASDANNLGSVLQGLGDLAAARALFERALAIDEAALESDHPKIAIRVHNLGMLLYALDDLATAQALLRRAVTIAEARLGPDHPHTRHFRANLRKVDSALAATPA